MRTFFLRVLSCGASLVLLLGCGKAETDTEETPEEPAAEEAPAGEAQAEPSASAPAPAEKETLPGANAVRSALASKDYNGAVGRLIAMRGSLRQEHWGEYVQLQGETRETLMVAAETDPKAAEPLMTLRAVIQGR